MSFSVMLSVDMLQMEWLIDDSSISLSTTVSIFVLFRERATSTETGTETENALLPSLFRLALVQAPAVSKFTIMLYSTLDNPKRKWKACERTTRDP